MRSAELLTESFARLPELAEQAVDGLSADQLNTRLQGTANPVGWLLWHAARVQDDHVAEVAGTPQIWTSQDWEQRFGLPLESGDIGYGHTPEQVASVQIEEPELLTGYLAAVNARTVAYVATLTDEDLDRVIDERWDPPVTLGVRLNSVLGDDLQHLGQAAYVRGLLL